MLGGIGVLTECIKTNSHQLLGVIKRMERVEEEGKEGEGKKMV